MEEDCLRQVLADAFLQEPDITTEYMARDDQLLMVLHNKEKQAKESPLDYDGEKVWTAPYRAMPDFQSFMTSFAENLLVEQEETEAGIPSYAMVEENIPDTLIDIDDKVIGEIKEH